MIARVRVKEQEFSLRRLRSGIGTRYGSAKAALIIDGDFAAFVTDQITDLRPCRTNRFLDVRNGSKGDMPLTSALGWKRTFA